MFSPFAGLTIAITEACVNRAGNSHEFCAGNSFSGSNELLRIQGNGTIIGDTSRAIGTGQANTTAIDN